MPDKNEPTFDALSAEEKAKMDYQMSLDKQKIGWGGSKLKEIAWDKGFFVLFVTLVVLFPLNWFMESRRLNEAKDLEKYKLDEARQRFFLEKKLDAMMNMESAMSKVTSVYFANIEKPGSAKTASSDYEKAIKEAREVVNRHEFLFEVKFREDVDRYLQVHNQMSQMEIEKWVKYRELLGSLGRDFDDLCQNHLEKTPTDKRMVLAKITFEERVKLKPQEYLDKHLANWECEKTKKATARQGGKK